MHDVAQGVDLQLRLNLKRLEGQAIQRSSCQRPHRSNSQAPFRRRCQPVHVREHVSAQARDCRVMGSPHDEEMVHEVAEQQGLPAAVEEPVSGQVRMGFLRSPEVVAVLIHRRQRLRARTLVSPDVLKHLTAARTAETGTQGSNVEVPILPAPEILVPFPDALERRSSPERRACLPDRIPDEEAIQEVAHIRASWHVPQEPNVTNRLRELLAQR